MPSGKPATDVPYRLMVQARQIYCYSLAARRGWCSGARTLVEQAYASMIRDFLNRNGLEGWAFSVHRDGTVAESRRDLYAHAFVLLAVASFVAMTGRRDALSLADETLDFIDRRLRASEGGGYIDALPSMDSIRRQNPHMHLFEALLALWSCSGDRRYLDRAGEIFELFTDRFFDPHRGILGEYFDQGLKPVAAQTIEPGHHYEWIWLLRWYERESGLKVQSHVDRLYAHADTYGHDSMGLIVSELRPDGTVKNPFRRTWPMTEAIKANIVEASLDRSSAEARVSELVERLLRYFLATDLPGGWIDMLDAHGKVVTDFMPASTFYHLMCAVDELHKAEAIATAR